MLRLGTILVVLTLASAAIEAAVIVEAAPELPKQHADDFFPLRGKKSDEVPEVDDNFDRETRFMKPNGNILMVPTLLKPRDARAGSLKDLMRPNNMLGWSQRGRPKKSFLRPNGFIVAPIKGSRGKRNPDDLFMASRGKKSDDNVDLDFDLERYFNAGRGRRSVLESDDYFHDGLADLLQRLEGLKDPKDASFWAVRG